MPILPLSDHHLRSLFASLEPEEPFVFLETNRITAENHRSLLFRHPVQRLRFHQGDDPDLFFARLEEWLKRGFYLAGWLAYEFGALLEPVLAGLGKSDPARPLVDLGVFPEPHIYDHDLGVFVSSAGAWPGFQTARAGAASAALVPGKDEAFSLANLRLSQGKEEYIATIKRIRSYIAAGDTYQVNYTLKYLFEFSGSAPALYRTLRRNQQVSYGAYIRSGDLQILSLSPELFFARRNSVCLARPMKGTIRRGRDLAEDEGMMAYLQQDPKNRSENVMIVDLLRNDLGRLSRMGEVSVPSLFEVETYETLHQMTSTVRGHLRPDISQAELFRALFPCGSVTGAPKIRTMEIISELESGSRGVYTGAIGYLAPNGDGVFSVPIRTITLRGEQGEMGIGSGIIHDSDPEKEWQECRLKGRFLTDPRPDFQLIETLLWRPQSGFWLLDLHLARLQRSARYFDYPLDLHTVRSQLARTAETFAEASPQRVRLTLDREGVARITAQSCGTPSHPDGLLTLSGSGEALPKVVLAASHTDSASPHLFHKTTIRGVYDAEREKAVAAGFFEVIFLNENGQVTEGAITNIFARKGDCLLTPPLGCGLLAGVFRQYLLESAGRGALLVDHAPVQLRESVLTETDLHECDALYVANSVRGLVRVQLGAESLRIQKAE